MGSLQFLNYFDDDTESLELDEETLAQHDKLRKVLLIQRNFRRYRLQQCIKICAEKYRKLCTIKEKREARIRDEYITAQKKPTDFPITKKDFDLLLSQIAGWKEAEVASKDFKDFFFIQFKNFRLNALTRSLLVPLKLPN